MGLWEIPLDSITPDENKYQPKWRKRPTYNSLLTTKTKPKLNNFYHAVCFRPIEYTLIAEIGQGFFKTWPNMTVKNLKMYLI